MGTSLLRAETAYANRNAICPGATTDTIPATHNVGVDRRAFHPILGLSNGTRGRRWVGSLFMRLIDRPTQEQRCTNDCCFLSFCNYRDGRTDCLSRIVASSHGWDGSRDLGSLRVSRRPPVPERDFRSAQKVVKEKIFNTHE